MWLMKKKKKKEEEEEEEKKKKDRRGKEGKILVHFNLVFSVVANSNQLKAQVFAKSCATPSFSLQYPLPFSL